MAEKEYIEREAFIHHLENCIDEIKNTNGYTGDFEICLKALKNQPTADGRGKWIKSKNERKCSLCGYFYFTNAKGFNYCPNCGAKMGKE